MLGREAEFGTGFKGCEVRREGGSRVGRVLRENAENEGYEELLGKL